MPRFDVVTFDAPARWWDGLGDRLACDALAVGAVAPRTGRRLWSTGELAGRPVTAGTTFYAASTTKQLVGALLARTVLDGLVDPEARVTDYLPGLPTWAAGIRVHHLLHHTGALPQPPELAVALGHADGMASWWRLDNASVLTALDLVPPPIEAPGAAFRYDNTGYVLLAEVLAAVRGRGVADLARTELFEPLGMTGSRLGGPPPLLVPGQDPPPGTIGDGGLWTCLADLLTWLEALNADRLGADLTALLQTPGRLGHGDVVDYAWGLGTRAGPAGTVYFHGGEWPGWGAMTVRCPGSATCVAVLAVTEDVAALGAAASELHDIMV